LSRPLCPLQGIVPPSRTRDASAAIDGARTSGLSAGADSPGALSHESIVTDAEEPRKKASLACSEIYPNSHLSHGREETDCAESGQTFHNAPDSPSCDRRGGQRGFGSLRDPPRSLALSRSNSKKLRQSASEFDGAAYRRPFIAPTACSYTPTHARAASTQLMRRISKLPCWRSVLARSGYLRTPMISSGISSMFPSRTGSRLLGFPGFQQVP
jgi:hypothetical protein